VIDDPDAKKYAVTTPQNRQNDEACENGKHQRFHGTLRQIAPLFVVIGRSLI